MPPRRMLTAPRAASIFLVFEDLSTGNLRLVEYYPSGKDAVFTMKTLRSASTFALLAAAILAKAGTITFDDIPGTDTTYTDAYVIPNGYAGFDWSNFYAYSREEAIFNGYGSGNGDGYLNGITSGHFAAFNGYGFDSSMTLSATGSLVSSIDGSFTSAFKDDNVVTVSGYRNGTLIGSTSLGITTAGPQSLSISFLGGADTVVFSSSDEHFVVDDLNIKSLSTVPAPAAAVSFALMALRRRRKG